MTEYMTMTADAPISRSTAIKLYDAAGFEGMRKAGRLAAEILDALVPHVVPGVTTGELDDIVRRMTLDGGGVPATLGYRGDRKSVGWGKRGSVRVDLGGRRTIKKKKK